MSKDMNTGTAWVIALCIFGGSVILSLGVDEVYAEGVGAVVFGSLLLLIGLLMCCTRPGSK